MSWSKQLEMASFRGADFEVQMTEDDYARRIARYFYTGRDGAELEDLGGEPRTARLLAVFVGPTYESKLSVLLQVIDEGKSGTFRHPLLGEWPARITRASVRMSHEQRDMATVDLELLEDGLDQERAELFSVTKERQAISAEVEDCEDEPGVAAVPEARSVLDDVLDFAEDAQALADKLGDELDRIRNRIASVIAAVRRLADPNNWPLVRSLKRMAAACKRLANAVRSLAPPVIARRLAAAAPAGLLAHRFYGDRHRARELLAMNPIKNPFAIPAGTEMHAHGR